MHASPSAFPSLLLPHLLPPPLSLYHSTQLLFSRRRLFEFLPLYYTKSVVFFSSFLLAQPYNSVRTNEVIWSSPFACVRLCVFVSYLINSSLFHRRRVTIDWPYRTRLPLALKKKTCSIYPWRIQLFCLSLLGGLQQVLTILCTPAHTKTKLKRITKKKEEKQQRKQCLFIRQPLHSRLRSRTFTRQIIVKVKKNAKNTVW